LVDENINIFKRLKTSCLHTPLTISPFSRGEFNVETAVKQQVSQVPPLEKGGRV